MVKFIGTYEAKLDDKGRVVVPAAYKSLVSKYLGVEPGGEVSFVIKKDIYANCLNMFTYQLSNMVFDTLQRGINLEDDDGATDYAFDLNEFFLE